MKALNRCADGRARIFNNALECIKFPQDLSKKTSVICEKNLSRVKSEPATHLPSTQESMCLNNILSVENHGIETNTNEYVCLTSDDGEYSLNLTNNQSDPSSRIEKNHLVLIQQTLHVDSKNELDLWVKESHLWELEQQEKIASDQVFDEWSPQLLNSQLDMCSWVENERLASIQETLHMDINSDSDLWIKENRLRALQQLGKGSSNLVVDECSQSLQNYQSDTSSWVQNNHLVLIQQTFHTNTENEWDLSIKENHLWSLQQESKDFSGLVVDECTPLLPTNSLDMCSWIENNHLPSVPETMRLNVNCGSDKLIEDGLQALQQKEKDFFDQNSSNKCFASCSLKSNWKASNVINDSLSYQAVNLLPHSPEEKFSKSKADNKKDNFKENQKFLFCEELEMQSTCGKNFSITCESFPNCLKFPDKRKEMASERIKSVCKSANELENLSLCEKFLVKEEMQLPEEFFKVLKPEHSSCDCFEERHIKQTVKGNNDKAKLPCYDFQALMTLKSVTGFFDSHCHLDLLLHRQGFYGTYADYMAQHKDSYPESYKGCIAIFCKPLLFAKKFIWQKHLEQDNVWAAFGCHPKDAQYYNDLIEEDLKAALNHHKVKALGEIGLDYSRGNVCPRDVQQDVFRRQLKIAKDKKMRLVIHCREADDDTMKIMLEILPSDTIFHLHCFTGDWVIAQRWIGKFPNVFIGITNVVTYPSAIPTHEVARKMPLDRLLLETDAPYFVPKMAPEGTCYSHPGMAIHVAAQVAALQNLPIDKVLQWTSSNTKLVYNIQ